MMRRIRPAAAAGPAARAALVPAAAFSVHQLRYWLAYGSHAGAELRDTGHSYLHSVVPWIVLLVGLTAGGFLVTLGRALAGRGPGAPSRAAAAGPTATPRRSVSFLTLWAACALVLIVIFCAQETLEGLFAVGHPTGLAGIFGDGGGWAIPAAAGVGLILATILHTARVTLQLAAGLRATTPAPRRPARATRLPRPPRLTAPFLVPVSAGWSDRGPPLRI